MSEHVWVQENIAAYVAGGLDASEGERLEKHVGRLSHACARFVDEAQGARNRNWPPWVLAANPGPFLEDRVIQSLPPVQATPRMNPLSLTLAEGTPRITPPSGKRKAIIGSGGGDTAGHTRGRCEGTLIDAEKLGFPDGFPSGKVAQAVDKPSEKWVLI